MSEVKIELTIQKSDWVDIASLIRIMKQSLDFKLATGGCKIINTEIKDYKERKECSL